MTRFAAFAIVTAMSCTSAQAPVARKVGMVLSLAGVAGLITAATIAKTTAYDSTWLSVGSAVVSAGGIATFIAGDLTGGPAEAPATPDDVKRRRWARTWTERAQGAARSGDCDRVHVIEPRVQRLDPEQHDFVFMRDPEIQKCFQSEP